MFNPWGTFLTYSSWSSGPDSNGFYSPSVTSNGTEVYGLFYADALFIQQNFTTQDIGTGATPMPVPTGPAGVFRVPTASADAKPERSAIVQGKGRDGAAAIPTRPIVVAATGIEALGLDGAGTSGTPRWARRPWARRFGSLSE